MPNDSTAGNGKDAAREARRQLADHKGAWRNRLLADRRVSNAAKVVGCAIAEHINRASKEAKVGVRRLALILHMSQSQVSKAIHDLADAGQLEVEWGVQGGGNNASTFRLVIDLETPDLFLFDKYELADFVETEKEVLPAELAGVLPAELSGVLKTGRRSSKKGQSEFTKRAVEVLPGEQNPGNPCNPVGTTGFTTTDADRESATTNTVDDAAIPAPSRPVPRAVARTGVAAQKQPKPPASAIGTAANGANAGRSHDQAYAALWRAYPNHVSENDSRKLFDRLLDGGIDPDMLIAAAAEYAKRCEGKPPEQIRLLCYWLRVRCWEDENRHWLKARS